MSDSDADIPSEASISRALRDIVIAIHKSGNSNDLTVKRVRTRAEEELGLPDGFLKNQDWKRKSQGLIHEAVDEFCGDEPAPPAPEPKVSPPKKAAKPKPEPRKKSKSMKDNARGVKRKAAAPAKKPQKRRKTASSDEESELSDIAVEERPSDAESEPPKAARRQKKVVKEDWEEDEGEMPQAQYQSNVEDELDEEQETVSAVRDPNQEQSNTLPVELKRDASDSDLSSLIDESPAKKKRQKKAPAEKSGKELKAKGTKAAKPKATSKAKAEDDPVQAEIKRLQSWLVKCGIRKVWGKELAQCDTAKEKIKHLKEMLKDAGMDGKYSNEKAAQIKEKREFAKDLEEIQAGAMAWGQEKTDTGRPRRRANKPIPKPVVPSDDEDEDEVQGGQDVTDDDMDDDDDEDVKGGSEDDDDDDDVESDVSE